MWMAPVVDRRERQPRRRGPPPMGSRVVADATPLCSAGASTGRESVDMRTRLLIPVGLACCGVLAVLAPPTLAAPPANDARTAAHELGRLPALVRGTTVEATLEEDEPGSGCGPIKNSVWFGFTAPANRELLVALDADGNLDAILEVFVRERSQLTSLSCQLTDRRGQATIDADATSGATYLIRVAARANSVDGT